MVLVGCARHAPPIPLGDDLAALDDDNRVTCYRGFSRSSGPVEMRVELRRTVSPEFHEIIEEWMTPDGLVLQRMNVRGSTFTIDFDDPEWSGSGELDGDPWDWDAWRWTAGDADAQMWFEYRVYDQLLVGRGGTVDTQIDESLEQIDCGDFG